MRPAIRSTRYEWRSASLGSMADARCAGTQAATKDTAVRIRATATNVGTSTVFTPNSKLAKSRVSAYDRRVPSPVSSHEHG